jgi:hypothetical protein
MAAVIQKSKSGGTRKLGRVAKVAGEQSLPPLRLTTARATRRRLSFRGVVVDKNQTAADAGYFWCDGRASDLMENKALELTRWSIKGASQYVLGPVQLNSFRSGKVL